MTIIPYAEIRTNRLRLYQLDEADIQAISSLRSNELVNKFIGRPKQTNIEEAAAFIAKINKSIAENKSYYWGIALIEKPGLIGAICIWNLSEDRKTGELGYELHPDHQGKGIMNEALKAVIEFAFTNAGIVMLEAYTHKNNNASTRLLQKNGFVLQPDRKDPEVENNIIWLLKKNDINKSA